MDGATGARPLFAPNCPVVQVTTAAQEAQQMVLLVLLLLVFPSHAPSYVHPILLYIPWMVMLGDHGIKTMSFKNFDFLAAHGDHSHPPPPGT